MLTTPHITTHEPPGGLIAPLTTTHEPPSRVCSLEIESRGVMCSVSQVLRFGGIQDFAFRVHRCRVLGLYGSVFGIWD